MLKASVVSGKVKICIFVAFIFWIFPAVGTLAESPRKPERIVSLNVCSDELVLELAAPKNIAALTRLSLNPKTSARAVEARGFRTLRGTAEEVLLLRPDLVLAESFSQRQTLEFLRRRGLAVSLLALPRDFKLIEANIRQTASALGEAEKGEALIRDIQRRLERISAKPKNLPRVLFLNRGGQTAGRGTFEHSILEAAGAKNLAAEIGLEGHGYLSLERVILEKPDFIISPADRQKGFSVGHEWLLHPVLKKGLVSSAFIFVPERFFNCGGANSVRAAEIFHGIFNRAVLAKKAT